MKRKCRCQFPYHAGIQISFLCCCRFTDAQTLTAHVLEHNVKEDERICGVCGYTTTKLHLYLNHMTSHKHSHGISKTSALFKCNLCGEKLKSKRLYQVSTQRHITNISMRPMFVAVKIHSFASRADAMVCRTRIYELCLNQI